jgi:hypothetical protein
MIAGSEDRRRDGAAEIRIETFGLAVGADDREARSVARQAAGQDAAGADVSEGLRFSGRCAGNDQGEKESSEADYCACAF